jgi:hypothetical protein
MPFINSLFAKQRVSFRHEIYFSHSGAIDLCFPFRDWWANTHGVHCDEVEIKKVYGERRWEFCSWLRRFIILLIKWDMFLA